MTFCDRWRADKKNVQIEIRFDRAFEQKNKNILSTGELPPPLARPIGFLKREKVKNCIMYLSDSSLISNGFSSFSVIIP